MLASTRGVDCSRPVTASRWTGQRAAIEPKVRGPCAGGRLQECSGDRHAARCGRNSAGTLHFSVRTIGPDAGDGKIWELLGDEYFSSPQGFGERIQSILAGDPLTASPRRGAGDGEREWLASPPLAASRTVSSNRRLWAKWRIDPRSRQAAKSNAFLVSTAATRIRAFLPAHKRRKLCSVMEAFD